MSVGWFWLFWCDIKSSTRTIGYTETLNMNLPCCDVNLDLLVDAFPGRLALVYINKHTLHAAFTETGSMVSVLC